MNDTGPILDRAAIEDVFRRLGDRLAKRGVFADIYVSVAPRWPWHMTRGDIKYLAELLDLHSASDVLALVSEIFPGEELPARLRLVLDDIFTG